MSNQRTVLTWEKLEEAIKELSESQKKKEVTLLDEMTGNWFPAERICITTKDDYLIGEDVPLISADLTPWMTINDDEEDARVINLEEERRLGGCNSYSFYEDDRYDDGCGD